MSIRLDRHEDAKLLVELERHRERCHHCQWATRANRACLEGQRLHRQAVAAARSNHLVGQAPWWEELDLRQVPTERHLSEWLGERELAVSQLEGIDVSQWQGAFPWAEAVQQGLSIGLAKASEGNGYTDPQWGRNVAALLAPGPIVPGSYHFLRPDLGDSPTSEAAWYLGRHPGQCFSPTQPWIFALDAESNGGSAAGCYAFLDAVSAQVGYSCWFYSYSSWITSRGVAATNRPLWIAWPNPGDPPSFGWPAVTMVQYGLRGFSVGQVDANRFLGPLGALLTLAGVAGAQPPAPPPIVTVPEEEDVAAYEVHRPDGLRDVLEIDALGVMHHSVYDAADQLVPGTHEALPGRWSQPIEDARWHADGTFHVHAPAVGPDQDQLWEVVWDPAKGWQGPGRLGLTGGTAAPD